MIADLKNTTSFVTKYGESENFTSCSSYDPHNLQEDNFCKYFLSR